MTQIEKRYAAAKLALAALGVIAAFLALRTCPTFERIPTGEPMRTAWVYRINWGRHPAPCSVAESDNRLRCLVGNNVFDVVEQDGQWVVPTHPNNRIVVEGMAVTPMETP